MKKLFYISFLAILCSCQVIPEAERLQYVGEVTRSQRRVLITELTGWRCPNCPSAAEEAHRLLDIYPDNLVVVEIHPSVNSFTKGSSYTSAAGDAYFAFLGGTATNPALPSGVVNFQSGFQEYPKWTTLLNTLVNDTTLLPRISLQVKADAEARTLTVSATTTPTRETQLLLWLVEDGIVGLQASNGETIRDYVHNHILRASLYDDPWGETQSNGVFTGTTYTVPDTFVWDNIKVVAVLLEPSSKEVLDVCEVKL